MGKEASPLIIFEPPTVRWLGPLTATRAVWDLRVGPSSVRELIEAGLDPADQRPQFWVRPELVSLYPRPAEEIFESERLLLLAGNQLPLTKGWRDTLQALGEGESLEEDGEVLALSLPGASAREFLESLSSSAEPGEPGEAPREGPCGPLLRFWWEIFELAPLVLERMLPSLLSSGEWHSPRQSDWPAGADIHLGTGVEVAPGVILDASQGPILLSRGVRVGAAAYLQGPCQLGEGTRVKPQSQLLHGCFAGPHCRLGGEIEVTQFQGFANKQHYGFLGHAVVGEWVNLGAGATNSDLKNNYSQVRVRQGSRELETGRLNIGCCLGDHVKVGICGRLNTGTVLEPFCNCFGAGFPPKYLPAFTWAGDEGLHEHRLEQALAAARKVMLRRGRQLDEGLEAVYGRLFEESSQARAQLS